MREREREINPFQFLHTFCIAIEHWLVGAACGPDSRLKLQVAEQTKIY